MHEIAYKILVRGNLVINVESVWFVLFKKINKNCTKNKDFN